MVVNDKGVELVGKVVGFELNSQDPKKVTSFYSTVFGWEISEPYWDYQTVTKTKDEETGILGGITKGPHDYPHGIRLQLEVDSIEEAIAKATANGALVVREKMEFDEFYLAYIVDPVGLGLGLIERK